MSRAFSDIAFTPAVRAMQSRLGSRDKYARLDAPEVERRDALGAAEIEFIGERDHFFLATVSETGWHYVQHKGGPAGFLKALDARTLGYADYRGNVQYVSDGNLAGNDRVSLILMDYAHSRRLKILGRAHVVEARDESALVASVADAGYRAPVERAVVITVAAWDWNCPKHITARFTLAEIEQVLGR